MPTARKYVNNDFLLALGVLASLETQFRALVGGIDPGSLLLVAWILVGSFTEFRRQRVFVPKFALEISVFWLTLAFGLSLGLSFSVLSGEILDTGLVLHDAFAYSLLAAITFLLALDPDSATRLRQINWRIILLGSILTVAQIAASVGLFAVPNIDPWYWDRWRGWTGNPNQLALLCLLLGFSAFHLAASETKLFKRAAAFSAMALFLGAGFMAKSNAFVLSALLGFSVFIAARLVRLLRRLESGRIPAFAFTVVTVASLAYAGVLGIGLGASSHLNVAGAAGGVARNDRNGDEETALRFTLWGEALDRAANSWMLGFGPGPHLPIPQIILSGRRGGAQPTNVQNPTPGRAPNFETHDTVLELLVQGGIISAAAFIALCGLSMVRALRAGQDGLAAALIAIGFFGAFHVVFRHPFIWVLLCSALSLDELGRVTLLGAAGNSVNRAGSCSRDLGRKVMPASSRDWPLSYGIDS